MSKAQDPTQFLPLTDLAFNLLVVLTGEALHEYALLKELRLRTGRADLRTGTVYAVLARLQDNGLIQGTRPPSGSVRGRFPAGVLLRHRTERVADWLDRRCSADDSRSAPEPYSPPMGTMRSSSWKKFWTRISSQGPSSGDRSIANRRSSGLTSYMGCWSRAK